MEIFEVKKVRAVVLKNRKILITNSKKSRAFILPGGKIEKGEKKIDAVKREVYEETGIELEPDNIEGPFYTDIYEYLGYDKYGYRVPKRVITDFFIATTKKDIDYTKMKLSPREIARQSHPYWINPSILEYHLESQKIELKSYYAKRYTTEFLNMYREFAQYQKKQKEENQKQGIDK